MVDFLLSRKTDFYFWTGITVSMLSMANFGTAYTEVDYMQDLFPAVTVLLLLLSGSLALFYFWSQNRADSQLGSGCFGGIVTLLVLFNFCFNLICVVL